MKEFLKSGKMIVSAVLAALGAIAATIAILQFTETKPSETWIVERDGVSIGIGGNDASLREIYQADVIHIVGEVVADGDIAIIANEIIFKDGASLHAAGANITLIATRIQGGAIRTDGALAADEGAPGQAGGSVVAVAALLNGSTFSASGGKGARGLQGPEGEDGEAVECGGTSFFQRAISDDELAPNDGRPGEPGGDGGAGGKGGVVKVYGHPGLVTVDLRSVGGAGGAGGEGGPGGQGVAGCSIVGFSIEDGDEGALGPQGIAGEAGQNGRGEKLNFDFRSAGPYLKKKLKSPPPSAAAARQIAELAAAAGLAE